MTMPRLLTLVAGATLLLSVFVDTAPAHHSTAIYDSANPIELRGTVVEWKFSNPHTIIVLEVAGQDGKSTVWSVEGGNTAGLFRQGWTPATLKPGDKIIVTVRPLRSGARGGNYSNVRWENGTRVDPGGNR
jgi:hypothetical protein